MEKLELVLFLTRQPCEDLVLKQAGKFYTSLIPATPSCPQNELIHCSVLKLTSPSVQGSTKPFVLSRSQLAARGWVLEQTGSENNKINIINNKHLLNTQVLQELLFPEKNQTPEPTNPGYGRGGQPDGHWQKPNTSGYMKVSIPAPESGHNNLTQYSPCIPKGSVFLMLTLHWINQPGTKVPLKLTPKNTAKITADLQLLMGHKAER